MKLLASVPAAGLGNREAEHVANFVEADAAVVVKILGQAALVAMADAVVGVVAGVDADVEVVAPAFILFLKLGVAVFGVEVVVARGPLEREGGDGGEEVPDGPGDHHVVEEGQERANAHDSLRKNYIYQGPIL